MRLYLVECANTVRNGVGAGIGTLVGKECKGAFNRSVPTAKYKAGECTCSYEWCGKAGKIRIVCVPARTKDKKRVQYNCGSAVSYKHNASTIAECYAGTQKVSMPMR